MKVTRKPIDCPYCESNERYQILHRGVGIVEASRVCSTCGGKGAVWEVMTISYKRIS